MSFHPGTIKQALAAQISAYIVAAGGRETNVRPYRMPVNPPCITMNITDITFFESMGPNGLAEMLLDLIVHVNTLDADSDDLAMDDYLAVGTGNSSSVADAVNSDVTLGGVVESCVVLEVGTPKVMGADLVAVFPLKILTRKVGAKA